MLRDESEIALDDVIVRLNDAWEDYAAAAETIEDPDLRAIFAHLAQERRMMVERLGGQLLRHGEWPRDRDTNAGTMHRLMARLKAALVMDRRIAMIDECERADTALCQTIIDALNAPLGEDTQRMLLEYQAEVTAARGRLEAMKARL